MKATQNKIPQIFLFVLLYGFILTGCSFPVLVSQNVLPSPESTNYSMEPTSTAVIPSITNTSLPTNTPTGTPTEFPSPSPTITKTSTTTAIPTITETPTSTLTETPSAPSATVLMQANCRYGPGTAYLYSHGLYTGDKAEIGGRNSSGTWLWVKPDNLDRHCWSAASVLEVTGNISSVPVVQNRLPHTTFAGPPENVQAYRSGDFVVVSWNTVILSDDKRRGYLLEVSLCQNGSRISTAVQTNNTSIEFRDERTCSGNSGGKLYTAEKHGYSDPVNIAWP